MTWSYQVIKHLFLLEKIVYTTIKRLNNTRGFGMGDGRYYTDEQFFTIIYLTCLIIFQVVTWMLYYYKSDKNKPCILMLSLYCGLVISSLLAFYAAVAVDVRAARAVKIISMVLIGVILTIQFVYLVVKNIKERKKNGHHPTFLHTILLFIAISIQSLLIIVNLSEVSLTMTTIHGLFNGAVTLYYVISLNQLIPYKVSDSIFNEVKNEMPDYVWIIDESGHVVYRNSGVVNDHILSHRHKINSDRPEEAFARPVIKLTEYENSLYLDEESARYFTHMVKHIENKGQKVGAVITVKDVTRRIDQLNKLKIERETATHMNHKLEAHKGVVYEMEKEKQINELLSAILETQQESLLNIKIHIEKLLDNSGEISDKALNMVLEISKRDLANVRNTVNLYLK